MENTKEKKFKLPESATVSHKNHRQRLYERVIASGVENTRSEYILELILTLVLPRVDTHPIAKRLMDKFGSLSAALDAAPEQLIEIRGIGKNASKLLPLFPQLWTAYHVDKISKTTLLLNRGQAIKYCTALLQDKPQEELYAICLDKSFKILSTKCIAKGSAAQVGFDYAELFRQIITVPHIAQVLFTHSHPNNAPYPSKTDETTHDTLKRFLKTLHIDVYDHIIVGLTHSYSMKDKRIYEN